MDDTILELATRTYDTVLLGEGGSPIGRLRLQADIHAAHVTVSTHYAATEQAEDAAYAAADHVVNEYPATLGSVLFDENWKGYADPHLLGNGSAVAHLGDGVWVHHAVVVQATDDAGAALAQPIEHDRLLLIAPCSCGRGYRTRPFDGEDQLLEAVHELTREPRSIFKHNCPHNCGSVRL